MWSTAAAAAAAGADGGLKHEGNGEEWWSDMLKGLDCDEILGFWSLYKTQPPWVYRDRDVGWDS